jgi:hypothetical protein
MRILSLRLDRCGIHSLGLAVYDHENVIRNVALTIDHGE